MRKPGAVQRQRISVTRLRTPAIFFGFIAFTLLFHWPAIGLGQIPIEDDVVVFYFPLLVATKEALARLALPLWTPAIFGGYPLFADGEAGGFYPLHLLILPWLTPEASLVALNLIHSWLASIFTYGLMRTLGGGRLGAIVGGICYAYSSFASAQIIHLNIFQAMVWLPLELMLVEKALRSAGARRYRYAVLAGGIVGIQALAAHVHVTLMSGLAITAFLAYRGAFGGREERDARTATPPSRRSFDTVWTSAVARLQNVGKGLAGAAAVLAIVGAIGVSLGAIQLFPLYELGRQTYRGEGVDAPLAAINSIWPGQLVTLLLPRLNDTAQGGFWAPWVRWDTTLYVGIMPLALATLALWVRAGRYYPFFGGLAIVALLITLGPNAPLPLWTSLHELPGFEVLRSPGRYSLLFSLCVSLLAGYGVDWVWRRTRPTLSAGLTVLLVGGGGTLALVLALARASAELRTLSPETMRLAQAYVGLPGIPPVVDGVPLTAERVAALAADALSPAAVATAWQLVLVGVAVLLVGGWLLAGSLKRAATAVRAVLAAATFGVIAADLWMVSATAHPYGRLSDLRPRVPDVLLASSSELGRVYTEPATEGKNTQVEPNRLMTTGIQDANGYSSLEPDRHAAFVAAVEYADNQLLDLWNVRHVVRRNRRELLPSQGGTSFHPERPLFTGQRQVDGEGSALLADGGPAYTNEVRVIATLWNAEALPDGFPAARIVLEGTDGSRRSLDVLAGRHVADARLNVPGEALEGQHASPDVAFQYPRENAKSLRFGEQLYYGRLAVDPPFDVDRVRIEPMLQQGGLEVFGIGLLDTRSGGVTQARNKAKYREVYRDEQIRIYENASVMPRAFLVGQAIVVNNGQAALTRLQDSEVDVRQTAVLELPLPAGVVLPTAGSAAGASIGSASITSYENESVVIRTNASRESILVLTDPYFPGWTARVDGQAVPILRANYLFRGVVVPGGAHTVTFTYEPLWVALGGTLTLLGALLVLVVIGSRALEVVRERAARRAPHRRPIAEPVYATADATGGFEA